MADSWSASRRPTTPKPKGLAPDCGSIELLSRSGFAVANALVDPQDHSTISRWTWRLSSHGYATRSETQDGTKRTIYMHRAIMNPQSGQVIDHVNGDGLDNRRSNLRIASVGENNANSVKRPSQTGYRGVYPHNQSGKYVAQISINGRVQALGLHDTPEDAARAYDDAALAIRGGFSRLNFPQSTT